ncbi:16S rRNA (cytidine(1402)-2'-O)-methyltransferase [Desulfosediminicola sp.]
MNTIKSTAPGTLYIVATPIGNLDDITLRALKILQEVDRIAAEDTRHTKKLLNHFAINTPLISYYREKEQQRGAQIIEFLKAGENIALVSDAGTPAISDPGAVLVGLAHDERIRVCPIPGASALTAAVSCSGFAEGSFLFLGFAPSKKGQRKKLFASLVHQEHPVVFYEAPRRVQSFLEDAVETLGNRTALWAREITKTFEEFHRNTLTELLELCKSSEPRGEFVIIIGPGRKEKAEGENLEELLVWYRDHSELSLKDASRKLAKDLGLSRSQIYQQALEIWNQKD